MDPLFVAVLLVGVMIVFAVVGMKIVARPVSMVSIETQKNYYFAEQPKETAMSKKSKKSKKSSIGKKNAKDEPNGKG